MRFAGCCIIVLAMGCDTSVAPVGNGNGDANLLPPSCMEANEHSDLEWIDANILTPSCAAFSACHKGAARSAGELNLEAGNTPENTIGVASLLYPELLLVSPGQPDQSYMLIIMGGAEGPIDDDVGTMPLRNPVLCAPKLDAVRRWISELPPTAGANAVPR